MAYKEGNRWTAQYYRADITGKKKQIKKRGFLTKRDALDYERQQKLKKSGVIDMKLKTFMEKYFEDKDQELKERTKRNKRYMLEQHIIPVFGEKRMTDITPADIIEWHNLMYQKGYSESYLRMINNQLTALFTHACKVYDMDSNPVKKVKRMGKVDRGSIDFWTLDDYRRFISTIDEEDRYYYLFEILFWTGCRIGEALALTKEDINLQSNQISITKTFYRTEGRDIITEPKTEQSVRTVDIPQTLSDEIRSYFDRLYGLPQNERIFPVGQEAVQHKMKRHIAKAGVKQIRVHDLRHSHVAYLIDKGIDPMIIKERLGHKDIKITLNTYGHLYPSRQKSVANLIDKEMKKDSQQISEESPVIATEHTIAINPEQIDYSKVFRSPQREDEKEEENHGRKTNVRKKHHR